jgi:hypothetical protein
MVLPLGHATGPTTLRLAVTTDAAGTMRLDLNDPEGGPLLHRWLPASERPKGNDCPALAETAALIVERYWHEVGYDVPIETPAPKPPPPKATPPPPRPAPPPPPPAAKPAPPPPPPPRPEPPPATVEVRAPPPKRAAAPRPPSEPLPPPGWWIGAGAGGLFTRSNSPRGAASLSIGVERPAFRRRLGLRLSAGVETAISVDSGSDHANIRQFPVRMGAYLPIGLGFGQLEPGIGVDLDVISVAFSHGTTSSTEMRAAPGADLALGWALPMPHDIFLRALAQAGIEVPYQVVTASNDKTIFTSPRFDLLLGLELGVWFP